MAVPASSDELERYTPPVLKNVPVPPVFLLRPADGRELRQFEYRLMAEGLQFHGADAFRAQMLVALKELWSPEDFEPHASRLRSYWALCDQNAQVDEAEAAAIRELTERLMRIWPALSRMAADNKRFSDESGRIAASMFIVGWTGLEVSYSRDAGTVPLAKIDKVEIELAAMETKAKADKVEGAADPGTAFVQLATAAYLRLVLTRDEEKNSSSPPPSKPDPLGSTKRPSKRTGAVRSKASASSKSSRAK